MSAIQCNLPHLKASWGGKYPLDISCTRKCYFPSPPSYSVWFRYISTRPSPYNINKSSTYPWSDIFLENSLINWVYLEFEHQEISLRADFRFLRHKWEEEQFTLLNHNLEVAYRVYCLRLKFSAVIGLQVKWDALIIQLLGEQHIRFFWPDLNCHSTLLRDCFNFKAYSFSKSPWRRWRGDPLQDLDQDFIGHR